MATDTAFYPKGPTYLVGTSPVQCNASPTESSVSAYRICNLLSTRQYLTWAASQANTPSIGALAPSAGTPSSNTIGIAGLATETFILPPNAWFEANAAAAFEITPGEGV